MEETPSYELPKASEKLASKFIFDALYALEEPTPAPEPEESAPLVEAAAPEAPVVSQAAEEIEPLPVPLEPLNLPPGKKYYRVREVAELTGVEPYVLRYWESEFSTVRPTKSKTGQRVYSRRDVEELNLIRHLLHVEKYSIKGAKKRLQERRLNKVNAAEQVLRQRQQQVLKELQTQLKDLLQAIKAG